MGWGGEDAVLIACTWVRSCDYGTSTDSTAAAGATLGPLLPLLLPRLLHWGIAPKTSSSMQRGQGLGEAVTPWPTKNELRATGFSSNLPVVEDLPSPDALT